MAPFGVEGVAANVRLWGAKQTGPLPDRTAASLVLALQQDRQETARDQS